MKVTAEEQKMQVTADEQMMQVTAEEPKVQVTADEQKMQVTDDDETESSDCKFCLIDLLKSLAAVTWTLVAECTELEAQGELVCCHQSCCLLGYYWAVVDVAVVISVVVFLICWFCCHCCPHSCCSNVIAVVSLL